jgi:hypothetical protein
MNLKVKEQVNEKVTICIYHFQVSNEYLAWRQLVTA